MHASTNGVTVLGSSGDGGTANGTKQSLVGNNPNNDLDPVPDGRVAGLRPARDRSRRHVPLHPTPTTGYERGQHPPRP